MNELFDQRFKKKDVFKMEKSVSLKRRAVACKSCHSLKVKCIPSEPNDPGSPCVRCIKTKRTCEINLNYSRKKKKPDDRVAELEQKIEMLKRQLKNQQANTSNSLQVPDSNNIPQVNNGNFSNYGNFLSHFYQQNTISQRTGSNIQGHQYIPEVAPDQKLAKAPTDEKLIRAQQIEKLMEPKLLMEISNSVISTAERRVNKIYDAPIDVIDAGIISLEEAKMRLKLYHESIYIMFPLVKVPTEFDSFRKNNPILFTTVMSVTSVVQLSSNMDDIDTDLELETISLRQVTNELLLVGNKTLELLKCLILLSVWYNTPEQFHQRRYHIFSSLCVNTVQDLGLTGCPYYVVNKQGSFSRDTMLEDPQKDEYRSLVLGIYTSSLGFSLFLRRKIQVHWSPYMEESYQLLKTCENSNFRNIAVLAKLSSVMERINLHVDVKDETNHLLIEYLNQEIQTHKGDLTLDKDVVAGFSASVEAYLYSKFNSKDYALKCYDATLRCVDHFGRLSPEKKAAIPVLIFGRLMYCFALLLKCINILKINFNYQPLQVLLDSLKICNEKYKKNHMVTKIRLLFCFYLTTFAKNEDVFNNAVEVLSADSLAKNVKIPLLGFTGTHPVCQFSNSQSIIPPQQAPQNQSKQSSNLQQHLSQNPAQSNQTFPPEHAHYQSDQYSDLNDGLDSSVINSVSESIHDRTSQAMQQPQSQFNQINGEAGPEPNTEPLTLHLDALSNEAIKEFNDFPNDFLSNQNELWKILDFKEGQFFI